MLSFIGQWRRVSLIKTLIVSLSSVILITSSSAVSVQDSGDSPITQKETKTSSDQKRRNAFLADPTIFYDQGRYYLYGTGNLRAFTGNPQEGFVTYYSEDLKEWSGPAGAEEGFVFCKGDGFGKGLFWAPQASAPLRWILLKNFRRQHARLIPSFSLMKGKSISIMSNWIKATAFLWLK